MTILNYSGGGGGRGRGRRGRGRGRGGRYHRGGGHGGRSFLSGRSDGFAGSYSHDHRYTRAGGSSKSNTKWVRSEDGRISGDSKESPTIRNEENDKSTKMTKKGHNKLVLTSISSKQSPSSPSVMKTQYDQISNEKEEGDPPSENVTIDREPADDKKPTDTTTTANNVVSNSGSPAKDQGVVGSQQIENSEEKQQELTKAEKATASLPKAKDPAKDHKIAAKMSKRSHNKLVLKSTIPTRPLHQTSTSHDDDEASHIPVRKPAAETFRQPNKMTKFGQHKLVRNNKRKFDEQIHDRGEEGTSTTTVDKQSGVKVSHSRYSNNSSDHTVGNRSFNWNKKQNHNRQYPPPKRKDPFRWNQHHQHQSHHTKPRHNMAKRIKVTVQPSRSFDVDDDDDDGEQQQAAGPDQEETTAATERLTDFAYRETGKQRPTGGGAGNKTFSYYHRQQQQNQNQLRNMGLVRVQPNTKKTPICPFYLKGIECTDKYCTKRHDVPKESAIPICSYFQRHGNCLKGEDCVFRHIKVNPRAMVCPQFSVLGFCDDPDCAMKHIRESNPRGGNGTGKGSGTSRGKNKWKRGEEE